MRQGDRDVLPAGTADGGLRLALRECAGRQRRQTAGASTGGASCVAAGGAARSLRRGSIGRRRSQSADGCWRKSRPGDADPLIRRDLQRPGQAADGGGVSRFGRTCLLDAQASAPVTFAGRVSSHLRLRGETARSAMSFERAVERSRTMRRRWCGWADLPDLARPDDAERLFLKVRSVRPQSAAGVFGRRAARKEGLLERRHLPSTLSLDPTASIVHYRLALAYRDWAGWRTPRHGSRSRETVRSLIDPLLDELSEPCAASSHEHSAWRR